jgi:hypothetical protein
MGLLNQITRNRLFVKRIPLREIPTQILLVELKQLQLLNLSLRLQWHPHHQEVLQIRHRSGVALRLHRPVPLELLQLLNLSLRLERHPHHREVSEEDRLRLRLLLPRRLLVLFRLQMQTTILTHLHSVEVQRLRPQHLGAMQHHLLHNLDLAMHHQLLRHLEEAMHHRHLRHLEEVAIQHRHLRHLEEVAIQHRHLRHLEEGLEGVKIIHPLMVVVAIMVEVVGMLLGKFHANSSRREDVGSETIVKIRMNLGAIKIKVTNRTTIKVSNRTTTLIVLDDIEDRDYAMSMYIMNENNLDYQSF